MSIKPCATAVLALCLAALGCQAAHAQLSFFTHCWILDAAQFVSQPHPRNTTLVTGDTVPDIINPPLPGLDRQLRVTNEGAYHSDHVRMSLLQNLFSKMGIIDAIGAENRKLDNRSDA